MMGDPEQYQQPVDLVRQDMHFVYGYEEVLILFFRPDNICAEGGSSTHQLVRYP